MNIKEIVHRYFGELVYIFSNAYTLVFSMLASIVATAFIEPDDMGVIQQVILIQVYVGFLHCGVFNGLNRNIAYYKSQNKEELVQDMVNTTYTVSYVVAFVGFLIAIGFLVYYIVTGASTVYILSSLLLIVLLVFLPISNAIDTTFRSGQEFKLLGKIKNIETTVYAMLSLLPIVVGYIGKLISDSVRQIFGYVMKYRYRPYIQTGKGSVASLKLLVYTGFPMLVSGYLWSVFVACDRTFIVSNLSKRDLGLYSLAGYVMTAVMVIPSAVNTLLYPKAAARYGQTNDKHDLFLFWKKSILIYFFMLVPICSIMYFLLPYLVENFMPKYVDGIGAAQYSLLTCMTFISSGPSVLFGTFRRNNWYIGVLVLSIVLFWGIGLAFNSTFNSLEQISLLRFFISFVQMICVLLITYKYVK